MDVITNPAYRQGFYSVLPCDAAEISMKPFLYFVADRGSSFRGGENNVNQATYVAVRHAFSRPFGTVPLGCSVPRTDVLGYSQPSLWDCSRLDAVYPGLTSWGYSQPSLWDFPGGCSSVPRT